MLAFAFIFLISSTSFTFGQVREFLERSNLGVDGIPVCDVPDTKSCVRVAVNFAVLRSNPERLLFPGGKILSILGPDEVDEDTSGVTYDVSLNRFVASISSSLTRTFMYSELALNSSLIERSTNRAQIDPFPI